MCKSAVLLKALRSRPTAASQAVARVSIKMTHGTEYFSTPSALPGRTVDLCQPGEGAGEEGERKTEGRAYVDAVCLQSVAKQGGREQGATESPVLV